MSDDLIAFLKAWHDWATNGALDRGPFDRSEGLCDNALSHCEDVYDELAACFGGKIFPFGGGDYYDREGDRTQHECPKRLAWVREKLVEAGELVA